MNKILRIALGCALLGSTGAAQAAVLCVNPANESCYATIQSAVDAAGAGDTVMIAAGTYEENVVISSESELDSRDGLILKGRSAATTIILASPLELPSEPAVVCPVGDAQECEEPEPGIVVSANNVTITGLTVTNSADDGIRGEDADFLTIRRVVVNGADEDGIDIRGDSALIEQSSVSLTGGDGIAIGGDSARVLRNQLADIGEAGIDIGGDAALIERNTIDGAGQTGEGEVSGDGSDHLGDYGDDGECIYLGSSDGSIVRRNQCVSAEGFLATGVEEEDTSDNLLVENNTSTGSDEQLYIEGANPRVLNNRFDGGEGVGEDAALDVYCLDDCSAARVDRNRVNGVSGDCFELYAGAPGLRASQNTARNCGGEGIEMDTGGDGDGGTILVEKNQVSGTDENDCYDLEDTGITARNNRATDCGDDGFDMDGEGFVVERNTATGAGTDGFNVNSDGVTLTRNRATGNGDDGFDNGGDNTYTLNFAVGNDVSGEDGFDYEGGCDGPAPSGNTFGTTSTCEK